MTVKLVHNVLFPSRYVDPQLPEFPGCTSGNDQNWGSCPKFQDFQGTERRFQDKGMEQMAENRNPPWGISPRFSALQESKSVSYTGQPAHHHHCLRLLLIRVILFAFCVHRKPRPTLLRRCFLLQNAAGTSLDESTLERAVFIVFDLWAALCWIEGYILLPGMIALEMKAHLSD